MSVVVLNRNYEYWTEASIKKVMKWLVTDKIEIVVSHDTDEVGSIDLRVKAPLVVRLLTFVGFKPKSDLIPFSYDAVYHRDNNICQYWHKDENGNKYKHRCTVDDRTIDHVLPVSRGGRNTFENCVCSCRTCNELVKKNRTPEEVGLHLIRKPIVPRRDKTQFVIMRFAYNPHKLSHQMYKDVILGGALR